MYVIIKFNKKAYFMADCVDAQMARAITVAVVNHCVRTNVEIIDNNCTEATIKQYYSQFEFMRDYKAANYLNAAIEHLPLDNG